MTSKYLPGAPGLTSQVDSQRVRPHVRWLIRRDLETVMVIERLSFPNPWTESEFIRCLGCRNSIGLVAEVDDATSGFMLYGLHRKRLQLLNLAVHPESRRLGIGGAMVAKLIAKLSHDKRSRITLDVAEDNLPAQLFFRSQGFKAISILRDHYDDSDVDAYVMEFRLQTDRESQQGREA